MSGDHGLRINLPASLQALRDDTDLRLQLVGDQAAINAVLGSALPERSDIVHAENIVPVDARPSAPSAAAGRQENSVAPIFGYA